MRHIREMYIYDMRPKSWLHAKRDVCMIWRDLREIAWYVGHDSFMCGTWLIHMWDRTNSYDSFTFEDLEMRRLYVAKRPVRTLDGDVPLFVRYDSFICGTWLIHIWDMTHPYVGHASFMSVTWLIHHWGVWWRRTLRCSTWLIYVLGMGNSYVGHDWFTCGTWLIHDSCMSIVPQMNQSFHTHEWVTLHIWTSHVTHMNESRHTYEWVTSHTWTSHITHMNESCPTYE